MKIRQKKPARFFSLLGVAVFILFLGIVGGHGPGASVYADTAEETCSSVEATHETDKKLCESFGNTRKNDCQQPVDQLTVDNCGIVKWITTAINVLSAVAGLVITAAIIIAGIQYASSKDDPQAIAAAKGRIVNAIIALFVFVFFYTFLQWVVPGGVL